MPFSSLGLASLWATVPLLVATESRSLSYRTMVSSFTGLDRCVSQHLLNLRTIHDSMPALKYIRIMYTKYRSTKIKASYLQWNVGLFKCFKYIRLYLAEDSVMIILTFDYFHTIYWKHNQERHLFCHISCTYFCFYIYVYTYLATTVAFC